MDRDDPYQIVDDDGGEEDFISVRTRPRNTRRQAKLELAKQTAASESERNIERALLLGENGVGISADELNAMPESERKQLLEAVLQSKEDAKMQEKKTSYIGMPETTNTKSPVKLECSIALCKVNLDPANSQRQASRMSLGRFKCNRLSDDVDEVIQIDDKVPTGHENSLAASATMTKCHGRDETVDKLLMERQAHLNKPPRSSAVPSRSVQLILDQIDDISETESPKPREKSISASCSRTGMPGVLSFDDPNLSPVQLLKRKYHIQVTDTRPLFRPNGLHWRDHMKVIYDYYTFCDCQRRTSVNWGKPIPIKVDKGKSSTRLWSQNVQNTDSENIKTEVRKVMDTEGGENDCTSTTRELRNRKVLNVVGANDVVQEVPQSTVSDDFPLSSQWKQEDVDIEARVRNSRQTKIGGGLADEDDLKITRRKAVKRRNYGEDDDDENDKDFDPKNRKKRAKTGEKRPKQSTSKENGREKNQSTITSSMIRSAKSDGRVSLLETVPSESESEDEEEETDNRTLRQRLLAVPINDKNTSAIESLSNRLRSADNNNKMECVIDDSKGDNHSNAAKGSNSFNNLNSEQSKTQTRNEQTACTSSNSTAKTKEKDFSVAVNLARPHLREYQRNENSENQNSSINNNCKSKQGRGSHSGNSSETEDLESIINKKQALNMTSFRIPKKTEMCPMCQNNFPISELEKHVMECVQEDDKKNKSIATANRK